MVRKLHRPSKRMPMRQRYNIQARISEANRKIRRDARKRKVRHSRRPEPIIVPNSFPGKEAFLKEYRAGLLAEVERKKQAKEARKAIARKESGKGEEMVTAPQQDGSSATEIDMGDQGESGQNPEGVISKGTVVVGEKQPFTSDLIPPALANGTRPTCIIAHLPKSYKGNLACGMPLLQVLDAPETEKTEDCLVLDSSAEPTREHIVYENSIMQVCRKFIVDNADLSTKNSKPCGYVVGATLKSLQSLSSCIARRRVDNLTTVTDRSNTVPVDIGVGVIVCGLCRR